MAQSFVFKPNEIEAANFELLFQRFGGFSAFIRKMAQSNGYKSLLYQKQPKEQHIKTR